MRLNNITDSLIEGIPKPLTISYLKTKSDYPNSEIQKYLWGLVTFPFSPPGAQAERRASPTYLVSKKYGDWVSRAAEIYPLRRNIEIELGRIKQDRNNGEVLQRYYQQRTAEGLSLARILKCITELRVLSTLLGKSFDQATKYEIVELIAEIERKDYSDWTKRDYKIILKKFYQWLRDCEYKEYPPEVKWIRAKKFGTRVKRSDLLTSEEVQSLAKAATNLRDKALILIVFDSGCRIGEILPLKIEDVEFENDGARLYVDGKTGKGIGKISWSMPALLLWLNNHPFRDNPRAPVFTRFGFDKPKQMAYSSVRSMLKKCTSKSGITKRVYNHLLRHSLATPAAKRLTHSEMCLKFNWKQSSTMPAYYVHLANEDLDEIQAKLNGQPMPKISVSELPQARECGRCSTKNSPESKFCNKCGLVLDIKASLQLDEARRKMDDLLNRLTEDPKKLEKLIALIEH